MKVKEGSNDLVTWSAKNQKGSAEFSPGSGAGGGWVALVAAPATVVSDEGLSVAALSWDLPTWEGLLMGWRRGEGGGVDREEEREERVEDVRGEAVEGEGEVVVGCVGIFSLGLV